MKPAYRPGLLALIASSVGTAMASVCALGLVTLHNMLPLGWSLAAIALAYLACRHLARVFAHLAEVVPSAAGLFAYSARA